MMELHIVVIVIIVSLHVSDLRHLDHVMHNCTRKHKGRQGSSKLGSSNGCIRFYINSHRYRLIKHHRFEHHVSSTRGCRKKSFTRELLAMEKLIEKQNPWERGSDFEGNLDHPKLRAAMQNSSFRWRSRAIAYEVDDGFSDREKRLIVKSLDGIGRLTCIKPRARVPGDTESVLFVLQKGRCYSWIGSHHKLQQKIYLDPAIGCVEEGTIKHEFMHTLGLFHQQSDPARDKYIKINWENIKKGRGSNFDIARWRTTDFGLQYDFNSIMHYSAYAFSKNGLPTIESKVPGVHITKHHELSKLDILTVNKMYNCT